MGERCLMAASLAVLVFHPSSTIKCFKPTSTTSPERQRPSKSKDSKPPKRVFTKSKRKQEFIPSNVLEDSEPEQSPPPPPPPPPPSPPPVVRPKTLFQLVSRLGDAEPAMGIVQTIFKSSWTDKTVVPTINKVLRVQHTAEVLKRFEEYRESVKSRAAEICVSKRNERWVADGNEVLRYRAAILKCSLGFEGDTNICGHQSCDVCSLIGFAFSGRSDWMSFCESSWRAHNNVRGLNCDGELAMRAMLICRVIAGRVAYDHGKGLVEGEEGGFDSMAGPTAAQPNGSEELIVLDPRGVLPCFVIIYNAQ